MADLIWMVGHEFAEDHSGGGMDDIRPFTTSEKARAFIAKAYPDYTYQGFFEDFDNGSAGNSEIWDGPAQPAASTSVTLWAQVLDDDSLPA